MPRLVAAVPADIDEEAAALIDSEIRQIIVQEIVNEPNLGGMRCGDPWASEDRTEDSKRSEYGPRGSPRKHGWPGCYFKTVAWGVLFVLGIFTVQQVMSGPLLKRSDSSSDVTFNEQVEESSNSSNSSHFHLLNRSHFHLLVKPPGQKEPRAVPPVIHMPDQGMGFPTNTFSPSLFCFSVMNCDNTNEVETIKGQLRHRIGIFACDNVAVLSGRKMLLGEGHAFPNGSRVQVETWYNPAAPVSMGNFAAGDNTNSFKNTDIFIKAWKILLKSKAVFGHDWTVKVDPDAVFFPYRLRWHLQNVSALYKPIYFKNCQWQGQAALYGSLEVFSQQAMINLNKLGEACEALDWRHWGEDQWIDTCMWSKAGGIPMNDFTLVGDHRCMDAGCEDTWRAAFHDYKSWWDYKQCYDRSIEAEKMKKKEKEKEKAKVSPYFCCTWSPDPANPCGTCGSEVQTGDGFCGDSKPSCETCGQATWCKRTGTGMAVTA